MFLPLWYFFSSLNVCSTIFGCCSSNLSLSVGAFSTGKHTLLLVLEFYKLPVIAVCPNICHSCSECLTPYYSSVSTPCSQSIFLTIWGSFFSSGKASPWNFEEGKREAEKWGRGDRSCTQQQILSLWLSAYYRPFQGCLSTCYWPMRGQWYYIISFFGIWASSMR